MEKSSASYSVDRPSPVIALRGVVRPMLWLALPVFAEQTLIMLVGFVDTYLAGHYVPGPESMAAIGLMAYTMWLLPNMFATISIGTTALVSRWCGAGRMKLANRAVHQAVIIGFGASMVVMLITAWSGSWYVASMQLEGRAAAMAEQYLGYLSWVIPCIMIEQVLVAAFRAAGDTMTGFVAMVLVNIVNALLSATLATGSYGFPRLGWEGLAIGTAVGHCIGSAVLLLLFVRGRAGLRAVPVWFRPNLKVMWQILRIGIPGGADVAAVLSCHLVFVGLINALGTLPAAAHSLTIRIESLAYLPGTAFQVSATTMAGQYLGANDPRRASRAVWVAALWALVFMVATGGLFFSFGSELAQFFTGTNNVALVQMTSELLQIAAVAMPTLALMMVLNGALRGAGDTRWPFLFSLLGMACLRIPLGAWLAMDQFTIPLVGLTLPGRGWGIHGAWYAMVVDISVRATLALWRFFHGGWRGIRI